LRASPLLCCGPILKLKPPGKPPPGPPGPPPPPPVEACLRWPWRAEDAVGARTARESESGLGACAAEREHAARRRAETERVRGAGMEEVKRDAHVGGGGLELGAEDDEKGVEGSRKRTGNRRPIRQRVSSADAHPGLGPPLPPTASDVSDLRLACTAPWTLPLPTLPLVAATSDFTRSLKKHTTTVCTG
jgi:hypothetical protein